VPVAVLCQGQNCQKVWEVNVKSRVYKICNNITREDRMSWWPTKGRHQRRSDHGTASIFSASSLYIYYLFKMALQLPTMTYLSPQTGVCPKPLGLTPVQGESWWDRGLAPDTLTSHLLI